MKILRERILQDGRCLEGGILKVESQSQSNGKAERHHQC